MSDSPTRHPDQEHKRNRSHVITTSGIFLAIGLALVILYFGLRLDQSKIPAITVGQAARAFNAEWIQGKEHLPKRAPGGAGGFSLDDFRGSTLVLNFWASWCVSCREEARELESFWQKYKSAGVYVVGIAIQDQLEAAEGFAKYFGKTYILGLDLDGRASIDYGVTGVPETFIINKDGIVIHKEAGPVTVAMLERFLPK